MNTHMFWAYGMSHTIRIYRQRKFVPTLEVGISADKNIVAVLRQFLGESSQLRIAGEFSAYRGIRRRGVARLMNKHPFCQSSRLAASTMFRK